MNGPQNESPRQKQIKSEDNHYRQPPPPPMSMRQNNKVNIKLLIIMEKIIDYRKINIKYKYIFNTLKILFLLYIYINIFFSLFYPFKTH